MSIVGGGFDFEVVSVVGKQWLLLGLAELN
jgi:hypothetical protein